MNNFFNSCRKSMNPWIIVLVVIVISALLYFAPIIGIVGLIAFLPFIGCGMMCVVMAFMMKGKK